MSRVGNDGNSDHSGSMPDDMWTRCTRPGCGDYVLIYEIDEHLDMHAAIALAETEEATPPPSRRISNQRRSEATSLMNPLQKSPQKPKKSKSKSEETPKPGNTLLHYFSGTFSSQSRSSGRSSSQTTYRLIRKEPRRAPGRLGKRELGPYAFEESMPTEIRRQLVEGSSRRVNRISRNGRVIEETIFPNQTSGVIPVLADMCALEPKTAATYFCHPSTRHIHKIQCRGNFCGYWSIQVLLSYLQAVNPAGPQEIPDVLKLQALIHQAWDRGICPHGKVETGGVMHTRKWIGTHEALALFTRIGVEVDALGFGGETDRINNAAGDLLDHVEAYFMSGLDDAQVHETSYTTRLPPIYLQRFGHSMTIVGLERLVDGSRNLLVFDSSFATSTPMQKLAADRPVHCTPESLLRPYRRSELSLTRWEEFEIIV